MTTRLRPWAAVVVAAAVLGTGCSHTSSSGRSDNTAVGGTGSASPTPLSAHDKGVKFAECMRATGVPHFPDPDPTGDVNFGVDVTPDVFNKAVNACKALEPPGALTSKRTPKEQAATLRFAACVRANGVRDFPDPVNGEGVSPNCSQSRIPARTTPPRYVSACLS